MDFKIKRDSATKVLHFEISIYQDEIGTNPKIEEFMVELEELCHKYRHPKRKHGEEK